jgi:hypothetical protein
MSAQLAKGSPLSILPTHHEDGVANESSGVESASQALQGHSSSQRRAYGSLNIGGGQTPRSPAKLSSKLFPEVGHVVKGIRRLSGAAQSHGFVLRLSTRPREVIHTSGTSPSTKKCQQLMSHLNLLVALAHSQRCRQFILQVLDAQKPLLSSGMMGVAPTMYL